ncbi:hypothetical protein J6590_045144 [Homalodisca vitripennis]|nr:hypothetical protein J6590_045144 [Homalodisca vitripennis]
MDTESALLKLMGKVSEGINDGKKVCGLFLDITKAFDMYPPLPSTFDESTISLSLLLMPVKETEHGALGSHAVDGYSASQVGHKHYVVPTLPECEVQCSEVISFHSRIPVLCLLMKITIMIVLLILKTFKPLFGELKILTLPGLVGYELCSFVKGNPKLFVSNGYYHQYPTRSRELISVAAHSTSAFERGPYHLGAKAFNALPLNIKNEQNLCLFKKKN